VCVCVCVEFAFVTMIAEKFPYFLSQRDPGCGSKCDYGMSWTAEELWFDFGQWYGVSRLMNDK
jgi:hypothetical protein